jgi:hypothetical protein
MAFVGTTTWYTSSARWSAVAAWIASTDYAAGAMVRQNATLAVGNERVFIALTGGASGAAEPAWSVTRGAKTTDNTVIWQECTGQAAINGDVVNTPSWNAVKNTAVSLGHIIKDNAGAHDFICSTAGTAGNGAEPSWNISAIGNTTADNGVTWTYIGSSFANWAAPHARFSNALATNWGDTGTKHYIGDDHAEAQSSSITLPSRGSNDAPLDVLCVNHLGSVPPSSADLRTTATITVTGQGGISISGAFRICYGITFVSGTALGFDLTLSADDRHKHYENCTFVLQSTSGGATFSFGDSLQSYYELKNCKFKFSVAGQQWWPVGRVIWRDTADPIDSTVVPNTFINSGARCQLTMRNIDLSVLAGKKLFSGDGNVIFDATLQDCKLPANLTVVTSGSFVTLRQRMRLLRCDSAGHNYRSEYYDYAGSITTETGAVRTGGATDQLTRLSWKLVTSANASLGAPMQSFQIARWNALTGNNRTVTIHGIVNAATVPNNDEVWIDVDYLGDAASPFGTNKSSRVADFLAASGGDCRRLCFGLGQWRASPPEQPRLCARRHDFLGEQSWETVLLHRGRRVLSCRAERLCRNRRWRHRDGWRRGVSRRLPLPDGRHVDEPAAAISRHGLCACSGSEEVRDLLCRSVPGAELTAGADSLHKSKSRPP